MEHHLPDPHNLSAKEYWQAVKTPMVKELCTRCGTTFDYFKHIANLRKRPSVDLARKMVAISQHLTPDYAMSLERLLVPREVMRGSRPERQAARR